MTKSTSAHPDQSHLSPPKDTIAKVQVGKELALSVVLTSEYVILKHCLQLKVISKKSQTTKMQVCYPAI